MEVSVTSHAGADVRAGSSCPPLVLPHWSLWCCPCPAHHPTTGAAPLVMLLLSLLCSPSQHWYCLLSVPVQAAPRLSLHAQRGHSPFSPLALSHSDSFPGLRLAEQLGRREDEAKIRHGLGLSLWASGNLEESQHQVHHGLPCALGGSCPPGPPGG